MLRAAAVAVAATTAAAGMSANSTAARSAATVPVPAPAWLEEATAGWPQPKRSKSISSSSEGALGLRPAKGAGAATVQRPSHGQMAGAPDFSTVTVGSIQIAPSGGAGHETRRHNLRKGGSAKATPPPLLPLPPPLLGEPTERQAASPGSPLLLSWLAAGAKSTEQSSVGAQGSKVSEDSQHTT